MTRPPTAAATANAAQRNQYLADSVLSAPPARLLTMLYDRLLLDLGRAEAAQQAANWTVASENLLHAQAIIAELSSSLKVDAWDGADGLLGVYNYASTALINANIQRDAGTDPGSHRTAGAPAADLARGRRRCPALPRSRRRRFPPPLPPDSRQPGPGTPSPEQAAGVSVLAEYAGPAGEPAWHAGSTRRRTRNRSGRLERHLDVLEMAVQAAERTLNDPLGPLSSGPRLPSRPCRTGAGPRPPSPGPCRPKPGAAPSHSSAAQERVARRLEEARLRRGPAASCGLLGARRRRILRRRLPRRQRLRTRARQAAEKTCRNFS